MNGRAYIYEAVNFFETRLSGRFDAYPDTSYRFINDVAALAQKTGYSLWHFSRLFTCVVGMPPKVYITGRILSECAQRIAVFNAHKRTLSALAFAAGFSSYESFSRSFKQFFSCSPTDVLKGQLLTSIADKLLPPFDPHTSAFTKTHIAGNAVAVVERPQFEITGMIFTVTDKVHSFQTMWNAFDRCQNLVNGRIHPEAFCQYTAKLDAVQSSDMMLMCALVTQPAVVQSPFFVTRTIPSGSFLHVKHTAGIETISETYRDIYISFFAQAETPLTSSWEYQQYNSDGSTDIYIPLL